MGAISLTDLIVLVLAVGIGVFAGLLCLFKILQPRLDPMLDRLNKLTTKDETQIKAKELNILYGPFIGLFFGLTIIWGTGASSMICIFLMFLGFGVNVFLKDNFRKTDESRLRAELAILYEIIEFYMAAGYTLPQSIHLSSAILPRLRPITQRVLNLWPQGPNRALQIFADEIHLSEAEVLTSILTYIEETGYEQGKSTIAEEARQLELVRRTMSEMAIINKPLFYSVYRIFPVAALGGVVLGPLVYRLTTLLGVVQTGF
jgi:Flp pilus assembly protein TadB